MTPFIKKKEIKKDWYIINAQDAAVGRLAAYISKVLRGKNKTEQILKLAVKRMLPGGPLAKKQLTKLKIYNGEKHPHEMQKPKVIDFQKLNKRNVVKL